MIDYVEIEGNGLISKFCEDLKNDTYEVKNISGKKSLNKDLNINNSALYVITFNSPKQFRTLIDSMIAYDKDYVYKTKKFLLDNSSDLSTTEEYKQICEEFDFEHIKKDNLGICGGRQWIAEHFQKETDLDYYLFFEGQYWRLNQISDYNPIEDGVYLCEFLLQQFIEPATIVQKTIGAGTAGQTDAESDIYPGGNIPSWHS